MLPPEYFHLNGIPQPYANHPTRGTFFSPGGLDSKVYITKGRLAINLLTPALELTEALTNGLFADPAYDGTRRVDYLRLGTYQPFALPEDHYGQRILCPYTDDATGFQVYGLPESIRFHGTIDVHEGYVHVRGELRHGLQKNQPVIPVEAIKHFTPRPLIPRRPQHDWSQALRADPLEVYELRIDKEEFDVFPEEILRFRNLESLWIGHRARLNCRTLPAAFFELSNLHTLQLYYSPLSELPAAIAQLKKLEELTLNYGKLQALPVAIGQLPELRLLSCHGNELRSLPEEICRAPALTKLIVAGNDFRSLPACMANIPVVEIDTRYRKYYMDTSYPSKNNKPIDQSLFNLAHYPTDRAQLRQKLATVPAAAEFTNLLVAASTVGTYLVLDKAKTNLPLGVSKVGGCPDLPRGWRHPQDKNGRLFVFHAQLNCREAAPYQSYLPRTGILYFFVDDEEYAQQAVVRYAQSDVDLERYVYTDRTRFSDPDLDGDFRPGVAVTFENAVSLPELYANFSALTEHLPEYDALRDNPAKLERLDDLADEHLAAALGLEGVQYHNGYRNMPTHGINRSVFTQGESPQQQAAAQFGGEPSEWLALLVLESIDEFNFWDAGTLTYCIHKQDLAIGDFATVHASIESS